MKHKKISEKKLDIFVSVVIVANEDSTGLDEWVEKATALLKSRYTNYELILVDNGLSEGMFEKVSRQLDSIACVRLMRLSRLSSYDTALFAGLDSAIGDYVCTFDLGFDSTELIPSLVEMGQHQPVVQGVSGTKPETNLSTQIGRRAYYWYTKKYLSIDIPVNATNLACYNRTAVNAMTRTGRSHKHIRHLVRLQGFRPVLFSYAPKTGIAKNHRIRTGLVQALEIAVNYSSHPLRFVTWLGAIAGAVNVVYAFYVVALNLTQANLTEGWTTTSLQLSLMFFVLFLIMVILAEYIGRILAETRRESYFVVDERSSQVSLADENRTNVEK